MRALLSSVGTRGDVQPIFAVALRLRALGHEVRVCTPPNFVAWAESFIGAGAPGAPSFEAFPVGVEMRAPKPNTPPPTAEELRRLAATMPDLVADQFAKVGAAAEGCDVILGANAHQYAARSIAEKLGLPYAVALYAPVAIPSSELPPPPQPGARWELTNAAEHERLWAENARAWNARALERVNAQRAALGLAPIDDVLRHNIGDAPWLATDAALGRPPGGRAVMQTGAWVLPTTSELPPEVEAFLARGPAPIYAGFGSMPAKPSAGDDVLAAIRALGRRAIVARGWAGLTVAPGPDVLVVDDVEHPALFPRTCAVLHHGGAGTTAAAARAGVPQVIAPMFGDQFYWASRVRALGIGAALEGSPSVHELASSLEQALDARVAVRARELVRELDDDGALRAANALVALATGSAPTGSAPRE